MIIKKHRDQLIQYGRGIEAPKLGKWQRFKTGVGKVGRGVAKVHKTVIVAPVAAAISIPKAAIAGTVTGIGSTLYSPVRLLKATGKTLYHGTKGLGQEAKRFIAYRQYKSAKAKLEKAQHPTIAGVGEQEKLLNQSQIIAELQTKKNNLYRKLKASTGRVYETRKQIGKSVLNVVKDVTPYRTLKNGIRGSLESFKKTAKFTGKHFNILGSDSLGKIKPTSMTNIIMDTGTKTQQPQANISALERKIQNDLARKQGQGEGQGTATSKKATAADYLALDRALKQQAIKVAKIQKIMKTSQYSTIEQQYNRNKPVFNDNFSAIISDIKRLAYKIPKLGIFDPERAINQKQYNELSEMLKVYDAVKTVKLNPTLFRKALKLEAGVEHEDEDVEA